MGDAFTLLTEHKRGTVSRDRAIEALTPTVREAAFIKCRKAGVLASEQTIEELIAAGCLAVVQNFNRLLEKHYQQPNHYFADVHQILAKALAKALRFELRSEGTDMLPDVEAPEPHDYDFYTWLSEACDELSHDWVERAAVTLGMKCPAFWFARKPDRHVNIARLSRWLGIPRDVLERKLYRLACRVAASCDVPEYREAAQEIIGKIEWNMATKNGVGRKDDNRGAAKAA